ncbi:MAG TPA: RMD1 family protein [Chitinophagaceae bacterium]|nr:RMD1 family protein [Chitinophagaceae bacterium]
MFKVISYQVSDSIDIRGLKSAFKAHPVHSDSEELFYQSGEARYVYLFKYGVVSFLNYDPVDVSSFLVFMEPFCRNRFTEALSDEFMIETGAGETKVSYNKITIDKADQEVFRMIMLNVSQSVALDYYSQQTTHLLEDTNYHTQLLAKKGRLTISGNNLKKYIGKTLLLKNRITENLYIFDSPPETWEDEKLDKLNSELSKNFELPERFRNVSEGLGIVKENLELFRDLLQYRNSVILEWIIIILIAIEVLNFFIEKLL